MSPIRTSLRYPRFRRLLAGLAVSQAGDWLYNLALLAVVYERTGSSTWAGVATASRIVPFVVLGPLGGVVADRFDRRWIMIASDLARAACMVGLAVVAAAELPIVLAPVLAAVATAAGCPYITCVSAVTPRLVAQADLAHANAARAAIGQASIVAGPAFGALLLLLGTPATAFLVNAASFGLAAAAVASLPAGPLFAPGGGQARPGVLADLRAGAAALRDAPAARRMVEADTMGSVVYGALTVLLLLVSRDLGSGEAGYGYMLAALGLGGLLATGVAGHAAGGRRPLAALTAAMLLIAVTLSLLAVAPTLAAVLAVMLLLGAGNVMLEVLAETGLQRSLDDEVFARAYGLALPATLAGIVAGSLLASPLTALLGVTGALTALGALVAAHALVLAQATRTRWRTVMPWPSSV
jgi:predicted MFS family arabinose efflux permease